MKDSTHSILIVEDNIDDLFILKRAFKLAGTVSDLEHAEDGLRAIEHLQAVATHEANRKKVPSVILLDLKLPRKNGFEVLAWIRQQPSLRRIVVLILTSSSDEKDIGRAYDLGANAFLVKPASSDHLTEIVKALENFWLKYNTYGTDQTAA